MLQQYPESFVGVEQVVEQEQEELEVLPTPTEEQLSTEDGVILQQ